MSSAYEAAGVNLELGDELSKMLYEASKQTWANREGMFGEPTSAQDSFSALRGLSIAPLLGVPQPEKITFHMGDDGIGTKVEVAQRVGDHSTIAHDLLAMVCDDAAIKGFEPAAVTTTLDVKKLDESMRPAMQQLALGYVSAANAAQVALVNGEVAELGGLVGGFSPLWQRIRNREGLQYNWSATVIAAGHKDRLLDGSQIRGGDTLVGFAEYGFRSNGLSLVRKTLKKEYGRNWHEREFNGSPLGELVLKPSIIYSPVLVDAIGGYNLERESKVEVHGAAHITGGGIPGKLKRLLEPTGLGANITRPFVAPTIMKVLQGYADVSDEEIYKVFNMGHGMIVATPEPKSLINLAEKHGITAKTIGLVTGRHSGIHISTYSSDQALFYK